MISVESKYFTFSLSPMWVLAFKAKKGREKETLVFRLHHSWAFSTLVVVGFVCFFLLLALFSFCLKKESTRDPLNLCNPISHFRKLSFFFSLPILFVLL